MFIVEIVNYIRVLVLAAVCLSVAMAAQEAVDPASFFYGVVTAFQPGQKVTVLRTILGKDPETRSFLIDSNTKIEGQIKVKGKVTVRFTAGSDGDTAVSIVVRDSSSTSPPKKKK